jgi:hypothetical protein
MCFKGQSLIFLMMSLASIFFWNSVLIKIRNFGLLKVHFILQNSESLLEELLKKNLSQILFAID